MKRLLCQWRVPAGMLLIALVAVIATVAEPSDPNEFYLKVSYVNEQTQEMETRFMVTPDQMRLVCSSDTINKFNVGDYVKAEIKSDGVYIGKTPCSHVRWHRIIPGVKKP